MPLSWGAPRPRPRCSPAARAVGCRETAIPESDLARKREVVSAFLAASRDGNFGALLTLLEPDVVLWADDAAVRMGAPAVVDTFSGHARFARPALVDGSAGAV